MSKKWKVLAARFTAEAKAPAEKPFIPAEHGIYIKHLPPRSDDEIDRFDDAVFEEVPLWEPGPKCRNGNSCPYKLSSYGPLTDEFCLNCYNDIQKDLAEMSYF